MPEHNGKSGGDRLTSGEQRGSRKRTGVVGRGGFSILGPLSEILPRLWGHEQDEGEHPIEEDTEVPLVWSSVV